MEMVRSPDSGLSTAIVALDRRAVAVLVAIWHMITTGTASSDLGATTPPAQPGQDQSLLVVLAFGQRIWQLGNARALGGSLVDSG